eukprot:2702885-Pleurochrysis_carterae.AAC.2
MATIDLDLARQVLKRRLCSQTTSSEPHALTPAHTASATLLPLSFPSPLPHPRVPARHVLRRSSVTSCALISVE